MHISNPNTENVQIDPQSSLASEPSGISELQVRKDPISKHKVESGIWSTYTHSCTCTHIKTLRTWNHHKLIYQKLNTRNNMQISERKKYFQL